MAKASAARMPPQISTYCEVAAERVLRQPSLVAERKMGEVEKSKREREVERGRITEVQGKLQSDLLC